MLRGSVKIAGVVAKKEMGGDKNDLKTVVIHYMGGAFTVYGVDQVYDQCEAGEEGVLEGRVELDPKSPGNNKFRFDKSTLVWNNVAAVAAAKKSANA